MTTGPRHISGLTIGSAIAHYRVTGELGRGGMGVVYEAEDTRLGRKVALKLLGAEAAGTGMVERLQREARAASALNHPGICTIFSIEENEGNPFITMERLDGESLESLLNRTRKPLPLGQLLDLGIQIADALDAAHTLSILHRDLKPSNLWVSSRGNAKVLDFGLAKLMDEGVDQSTIGHAGSMALTSPGVAVGTVAYMSPEQARGEPLDARSDIFSFGIVLYQMATGELPFQGSTSAVIFDAILNREPVRPGERNPQIPPELDRVVDKALEKDKDLRYQSAAELRADLKRVKRASESGKTPAAGTPITTPSGQHQSASSVLIEHAKRSRVGTGAVLMFVLLLIAAAGLGVRWMVERSRKTPFQNIKTERLSEGEVVRTAAMSPDGKYVVYVLDKDDRRSMWIRHLPTNSNAKIIEPDEGDYRYITFAPDGNFFYYLKRNSPRQGINQLFKAPVLGGAPQSVLIDVDSALTFSPDGKRFAFRRDTPDSSKLMLANVDGTGEKELSKVSTPEFYVNIPAWAPDGDDIAIVVGRSDAVTEAKLSLIDSSSGKTSSTAPLKIIPAYLVWHPAGRHLIAIYSEFNDPNSSSIALIDPKTGEARSITSDLTNYSGLALSVTADGKRILSIRFQNENSISIVPATNLTASTAPVQGFDAISAMRSVRWTPDNNIIVFYRGGRVEIRNPAGKLVNSMTLPGKEQFGCALSDGSVLFSRLDDKGVRSLWMIASDGSNPHQVESDFANGFACAIKEPVAYYRKWNGKNFPVMKLDLKTGKGSVFADLRGSGPPFISPNGESLAVQYSEGDTTETFANRLAIFDVKSGSKYADLALPQGTRTSTFGADSNSMLFAIFGKENFYLTTSFETAETKRFAGVPPDVQGLGFSPDGKSALVIRLREQRELATITDIEQ